MVILSRPLAFLCTNNFNLFDYPIIRPYRICTWWSLFRVSLVERELLTLPEHLSSPPVFSGVRVTRSLVLYVCFVARCLFFFDIQILIIPLVSSNSSYYRNALCTLNYLSTSLIIEWLTNRIIHGKCWLILQHLHATSLAEIDK